METEQLYANGKPICPATNYEEDNAAQAIQKIQNDIIGMAAVIVNDLLKNTDISEWAKAAEKPSYSAAEVGADAAGSAADAAEEANIYTDGALEEAKAYSDAVQQSAKTYTDNALQDAKLYTDNSLQTAENYTDNALAAAKEYADSTYTQATGYTNQKIAELIGTAPEMADTLGEIFDLIKDNETVEEALNAAIASKANEVEFQAHQTNGTIHTTKTEKENWNAAKEKIDKINTGLGTCSTAADTAAKEVTLVDNPEWELKAGSMVTVKFTNTNTAQNPTLNVNGTGAKSILYNTAVITTSSLAYAGYAGKYIQYVYDGTQYVFMGWSMDANTTYTPSSLGGGYGTCSTAAATAAKAAALSGYSLVTGGIVSIKFTYDVPAGATLNINSKGAKAIYYRGASITAGVIKSGDIATFRYSGQYHLLAVDRDNNTIYETGTETEAGIAKLYGGIGENTDGAMTQAAVSALLEEMQTNFQDGCSVLAAKLTACGADTADNASPDTMAANIQKIYTDRYNAGTADADARVNTASANYKGGYNAGVSATKKGTAAAAQVLSGYTFTNASGVGLAGSMANNGAVSQALNCGGSYTIPAGYHNGSGKVTAKTLASQTAATATAANITSGKTAYVNGVKVTGTGADNTANYNSGYNAGYAAGGGGLEKAEGSFSVTRTNGQVKTETVNFGKTFKTVPSFGAYIEGSAGDIAVARIESISTTSCTFYVINRDSATVTRTCHWVAVGEV